MISRTALAISENRTIYSKSVQFPNRLLKPGANNGKLGNRVTKGLFPHGLKMLSLTFEERKTCVRSCEHYSDCYGNNMPFAHRVDHGHSDLYSRLEQEIAEWCDKEKVGILVRLHVLGDFFNAKYVNWWHNQLFWHPKLHIFGYTAQEGETLSAILWHLNSHPRCIIRQSRPHSYDGRNRFATSAKHANKVKGFMCPEQKGLVDSCAACGLCWSTNKTVIFEDH